MSGVTFRIERVLRKLKYLSYSGFKLFESDPEKFYERYIAETKSPRDPQNHYMAIGSAFDAYVKAELHHIFVNDGDPKYKPDTLFEAQVEPHNRDRARVDGQILHTRYVKCGAWKDLLEDMKGCINPRFEVELTAELSVPWLKGSIKILGKPDIQYISRAAARVVHDFKCQGYYSKSPPSPARGYLKMFPGATMHEACGPKHHKDFLINGNCPLHLYCEDWATQLTFYAWSLGEEVGSDYILTVDQILSDSQKKETRVAKHAAICTEKWQRNLFERAHKAWYAAESGHVFTNLTYEESVQRTKAIDAKLQADFSQDPDFLRMTRKPTRER